MLWFIDGLTVSGSCIICALLGRHIDRPSVYVSVYYDILTEKRPMCRLIYWPKYWLYWSVECRLICRPIVVVQLSAELWIDSLLTFHQYTTSLILEYLVDCSPCCSVNSLYVRNACGGAAQISLFCPPASQWLLCINCCTSLSKIGCGHLSSAPNKILFF